MKICQFAIPRIKSSRRSLPLGGSVTVIQRAPFRIPFVRYDQKDRRPKPGRSPISPASACGAGQAAAPADVRKFGSRTQTDRFELFFGCSISRGLWLLRWPTWCCALKEQLHADWGSYCAPMHNDWNCHSSAPVSHWHGPGKIPHVPLTLESRGCSLLELRCWSLTMTGLRLALRV
jgi:hypothetical protein